MLALSAPVHTLAGRARAPAAALLRAGRHVARLLRLAPLEAHHVSTRAPEAAPVHLVRVRVRVRVRARVRVRVRA